MTDGRLGSVLTIRGPRKPCPFCGGEDQWVEIVGDDETKFCYQVVCTCLARGKEAGWIRSDSDGIEAAVQAWNQRES